MDSDAAWERRRRENDFQSGTTTVSWEIRGSEIPGNETKQYPAQWAKEVHQPVVSNRSGKKGNGMLVSPASRDGMLVWSCETQWTEAASVRQNWMRVSRVARRMSRHKESPR